MWIEHTDRRGSPCPRTPEFENGAASEPLLSNEARVMRVRRLARHTVDQSAPGDPGRQRHVVLAVDGVAVVGFITAISDGLLAAYVPLLEVRPEYRGRGIGSELVRRMVGRLEDLYMVDLVCDPELESFTSASA